MKFIDEVMVKVQAGKGGDGMIAFRREAHVDKGGPDGGDGGNGGSIFFIPNSGINTLLNLYLTKIIKGEDGEKGRRKNQYGAAGKDLYIKVPFGTIIYNGNTVLADLTEDRPYLIAKGGKGGRGNTKFKSSRNTAPAMSEKGDLGQKFDLLLNLKVMADVGFVGKPSAGKSTLLSKISNAKPKIADYSFTTLVPQLGLVQYEQDSFVVADLPGLIEGAHQGRGLGHQFLKHIERCRIIAHIIDFGDPQKDPVADYLEINQELKSYNLALEQRRQVIIANKSDLANFAKHLKQFQKTYPKAIIVPISAIEEKNLLSLKATLFQQIKLQKIPIYEKVVTEVTITLESYFDIRKIHEGLYEIFGPDIEKIYHKIPLNSHDNLMFFNKKIKDLGVWKELDKKGVKPGDTVRIFDYEFTWEDDYE